MRVVIPSVMYADFLAIIVPLWRRFLPSADLTIVTTHADAETVRIAQQQRVAVWLTDAWTRSVPIEDVSTKGRPVPAGPLFNKALALDEAFGFMPGYRPPPDPDEVCLAIDADVLPAGPSWDDRQLQPHILYGAPRYGCPTPAACQDFLAGRCDLSAFPLVHNKVGKHDAPPAIAESEARKCLGYFQLFRYRPSVRFGSFATAARYDLAFHTKFTTRQRVPGTFAVLHLGERNFENWKGRRTVPPWPAEAVCP